MSRMETGGRLKPFSLHVEGVVTAVCFGGEEGGDRGHVGLHNTVCSEAAAAVGSSPRGPGS